MAPRMKALAAALGLALLSACAGEPESVGPAADGRVPLTPVEVFDTFIGAPWSNETGTYVFDPSGIYSFTRRSTGKTTGPWPFVLLDNGVLRGPSATFAFYRSGDAYEYYSPEADQFFSAYPGVQ